MCARCEELQEEVRQLRALLKPSAFDVPLSWKLSASQREMFLALYGRRGKDCSVEFLFQASRKHGWDHVRMDRIEDVGSLVSVYIHHIRTKLRIAGAPFVISTVRSIGFRLDETNA